MQGEEFPLHTSLEVDPLFPFMAPTLIFKRRRESGRMEPGREVERPLSSSQRGESLMPALRCLRLLSPSFLLGYLWHFSNPALFLVPVVPASRFLTVAMSLQQADFSQDLKALTNWANTSVGEKEDPDLYLCFFFLFQNSVAQR